MNGNVLLRYLQKKSQSQALSRSSLYLLFSLSFKSLPSPSPCSSPPYTLNLKSPTPLSPPFLSSFPSTPSPSSQLSNTYSFLWFRSFSASVSSSSSTQNASAKLVSEIINLTGRDKSDLEIKAIINLIRKGESDLETKLNDLKESLSEVSLKTIFRILNRQKVSSLRFFTWIRQSHPQFSYNSDICSLVIDNCGRLDDFDSMFILLDDFGLRGIRLNQMAFGFIPVILSSRAATEKSISKIVQVLNRVGGSSAVSGIHALIEKVCILGSFEMAEFVISKTEKSLSNYNILIKRMCNKGHFEEARRILDEMIKVGFQPNAQIYNYVLSCLCKNGKTDEAHQLFEQMLQRGFPPDAITFEVFICYMCRKGKLDMAIEWIAGMESRGIEPRASTHAAIIKGYFELQQYEEAHQYVVFCCYKYKTMGNMIYSLLANLHRKRGKPVIAQRILSEMMKKGLKPNFSVYMAVRKQLRNSGKEDLARNLESSFSSIILISKLSVDNG